MRVQRRRRGDVLGVAQSTSRSARRSWRKTCPTSAPNLVSTFLTLRCSRRCKPSKREREPQTAGTKGRGEAH